MPPTTLTFGCRLNAAESRAMSLRAAEAGLSDAILVNTCAVTAEAVRQARQAIRKARREHPRKKIVVSGCAAQTEPEKFAAMPEVDLVLGNEEKLHAESYRRLWSPPNLPHAEVLRKAKPRSTQFGASSPSSTALRGNADTVGVAPQDVGHQTRLPLPDFGLSAQEKILVGDIFAVTETAAHMLDGFAAPMEMSAPAPSCRCRTAAIIAAPSASSLMAAGIRAPCRWAR